VEPDIAVPNSQRLHVSDEAVVGHHLWLTVIDRSRRPTAAVRRQNLRARYVVVRDGRTLGPDRRNEILITLTQSATVASTAIDKRERERERILFATALQAYQKGYKPI